MWIRCLTGRRSRWLWGSLAKELGGSSGFAFTLCRFNKERHSPRSTGSFLFNYIKVTTLPCRKLQDASLIKTNTLAILLLINNSLKTYSTPTKWERYNGCKKYYKDRWEVTVSKEVKTSWQRLGSKMYIYIYIWSNKTILKKKNKKPSWF